MKIRLLLILTLLLCLAAPAQASEFTDRASTMAKVTGVRIGTSAEKIRIVIDTTKPVTYKKMVLSSPTRVVVDIANAWLATGVKTDKDLNSPYATHLKVAQFDKSTVRVVVETGVGKNGYNIFKLTGGTVPGRVVLDFGELEGGASSAAKTPEPEEPVTYEPPAESEETGESEEDTTEPLTKEEESEITREAERTAEETITLEDTPSGEVYEPTGYGSGDELDSMTSMAGLKICLDPGHGGSDSGAIGPTGVTEKSVTLRVAKALQKILSAEGATVYMTRTEDTEVSPKKGNASDIEELQARCDVANSHAVDIFISIHMDSFTNSAANGTTGYYYSLGSQKSRNLADCIRQGVIDQIGTQSRGTQSCNFYVVKNTNMPATLVEVAFISNKKEEKLMDSSDGIQKAAQGIADGIADYLQ